MSSTEHLIFFHRIASETIDFLIEGNYTNFDAQTTSNCCHGLAILARELVLSAQKLPLLDIKNEITSSIRALESDQSDYQGLELIKYLPGTLIDLASLYVLTLIIEIDPIRGRRTVPIKLRKKGLLGTSFCEKIVKKLQRTFSNLVAERYKLFLQGSENNQWVSKSTIRDWGKYVEAEYLRLDRKGVKYASCMFSMQVCLHYLTRIGATVALVNDLMDPLTLAAKGQYIRFLKGNEEGILSPVHAEDIHRSEIEPVIVFGGYVFSNKLKINDLAFKMKPWVYQFSSLILACDTRYPQFPNVADDPNFDSTPINPSEKALKNVIDNHSKIKGVSAEDPSLFCLSHIFLSNPIAILSSEENKQEPSLPPSFIPCKPTSEYLHNLQQ